MATIPSAFYNDCLMLEMEMNGQGLGTRKLEKGIQTDSIDRLKSHSMAEIQEAVAEIERNQKTESKSGSLCTIVDLRISSKSLLFCHYCVETRFELTLVIIYY